MKRLKNASAADVARLLGAVEERMRHFEGEHARLECQAENLRSDLRQAQRERDELRQRVTINESLIEDLRQEAKDAQSPLVEKIREMLKRLGEDSSCVHGLGSGTVALMLALEKRTTETPK